MTVVEAVSTYVAKRREEGRLFVSSERILRILCRDCGDIDLRSLSAERLSLFVNNQTVSSATRMSKFSAVNCFVNYWSVRGKIPKLTIQKPQRPTIKPAPYIYTAQQVRSLLRGSEKCQRRCKKFSGETLRAILTTIYGTGATIDEVLSLRISGVHLKRRRLTFEATPMREPRTVPIGADLHAALKKYVRISSKPGDADASLFRGRKDDKVSRHYVYSRFHRLCTMVQLPDKADGRSPRMLDLRYTFAVHRLTHWIRQKENLNELLPALSMYMGYATLTKAEQFLAFAPERFKADLQKLSTLKGRKRWRNDAALLASLAAL